MKAARARPSFPHLDAYLPLDRRLSLAQGRALPESATGTVLFADLSGFTPLMEHLSSTLGPQQGAEEMTRLLNALFTPLIGEIHGHGGDIIAFEGDALTCWFPGPLRETSLRAAANALEMQRHVAALGPVETPAGPVRFSMHVGVASGEVLRFRVGKFPYGFGDVLAGATVDNVAEAEHRAGSGEVVVDMATAAYLPAGTWQPLGEELALLSGWPGAVPPLPTDTLRLPPPLPTRQVRRWLAEPLYRRLRASQGDFAAELRLVTSVFVQFIGLDYDGDPHAGRKLQRYVVLAQERLAPYEGYLVQVSCGDKGSLLYILFGAPIAHEDDTKRAVGFALEFQEAVQALPFIQGQRIGISPGWSYAGILGSPARCIYSVLGDEVNVSARLMQTAAMGQVLVSQWVQEATAGHYTFRSLGAVPVKGKEKPVLVFEPQSPRAPRPAGEQEEWLVGREQERRTLAALLAKVQAGQGHVLLLLGEAGVGKSALVRYLGRQARQCGWGTHVGACLSYGQSTSYLPWRAILEEVYGLSTGSSPDQRAARLEMAVADLPAPPDRPGYWRARFPLLAEAMALDIPDTPLTCSLEGELRRDNTFQLLEALVRHLATERPALVVLEDAYWADELSLSLAAQVGRNLADLPLFLVIVHRPFVGQVSAGVQALQSLPQRAILALTALEEDSSLELARQRLQGAALPPRLAALLHEKARGNPFFIEELLRALQDAGYLRHHDGTVELVDGWESLDLPATIEGVVRARIDRLLEEERLTLKVSAVIGRTFQRSILQEVHPARPAEPVLGRQLARLDQAKFTQLEEAGPQWRYAFRHPILHEVTYETLLFAQRRQLHGTIGGVLEQQYAADLPRVLDLLAYHYARSEERGKALHYLQLAGDKARREYANEVALDYYSQALERLLPQEVALHYDFLAGRERIYNLQGERDAQEQDLQEMGRLAIELADPRRQAEVLNRQARREADSGAFSEASQFAHQAWRLAAESADWAAAAAAQKVLGIVHASAGEYEEALRFFVQSQEICRRLGDYAEEASCLGNLGLVYFYQGNAEQARAHYARSLELVRAQEDRLKEIQALINLGLAESNLGAYERALECLRLALTISREIGSATHEGPALDNIGVLEMNLGDLAQAAIHYQQALDLARRLQDREGEAVGLSNAGLLSAYQGDLEQGRHLLQEALAQYQAMGHRRGEAITLHHQGQVELWAGEAAAARESFLQALDLRQEIGEMGNALVTRAWLGLACLVTGDQEQARTHLEQVLAQLEAEGYGGDDPEQEIWWAAFQVWQAAGEKDRARQALEQAHQLVQKQASRIHDPTLKRSFLEQVPVNREIGRAWAQVCPPSDAS